MAVLFTYSAELGFVEIPGDPLSQMSDPIDGAGAVPSNYIKSVYEATYFRTTITMQGKYLVPATEQFTYENAIDHTTSFVWANHGLTYTKINGHTFKLEGPVTNVFLDQYYEFSLTDYSSQILPFNTTTSFWSLNRYEKPNPVLTEFLYPLTITIPPDPNALIPSVNNTVEQVDLHQWVVWRYQTAIDNILYLKTQGLK
jgi:hypothetical protein